MNLRSTFIFLLGLFSQTNGSAEITIQLLSYVNPTFGLADDGYYCGYTATNIPPPPNTRGYVALPLQQNGGGFGPWNQNQNQNQNQFQQQNQNQYQQQPIQNLQNQNSQQQFQQQQFQSPYRNEQQSPNRQYSFQQNPNPNPQAQYPPSYQQNQQQFPSNGQNQQQFPPQNQQQQFVPYNNQQQQNLQQPPQQMYRQQNQPPYQQNQQYQQQNQRDTATDQPPQNYIYQQRCIPPPREFSVPNWNECRLSFATIFATLGGEPQVITSGLISLPSENATIMFNDTTWSDKCAWQNCNDRTWVMPRKLNFTVKPAIIEVVVTHFGDSVYGNGQQFTSMGNDQAMSVDKIAISLVNVTPAASSMNQPPLYVICVNGNQRGNNGYPLSTLNLAISIKCKENYFGNFCNLTDCNTYDNQTQICASSIFPGQYMSCQYDHTNQQPVNCTMCPYGVKDGRCGSADAFKAGGNQNITGYIVGIAILAILLAIAIVALCIGGYMYYRDGGHKPQPSTRSSKPPAPVTTTTTSSSMWGTKTTKNGTNGAPPVRSGYTPAPTEESDESEWQQNPRNPVTLQQSAPPRPYNLPPAPNRQPPSSGSTPEHNGSRREAAV